MNIKLSYPLFIVSGPFVIAMLLLATEVHYVIPQVMGWALANTLMVMITNRKIVIKVQNSFPISWFYYGIGYLLGLLRFTLGGYFSYSDWNFYDFVVKPFLWLVWLTPAIGFFMALFARQE